MESPQALEATLITYQIDQEKNLSPESNDTLDFQYDLIRNSLISLENKVCLIVINMRQMIEVKKTFYLCSHQLGRGLTFINKL